MTSIKTLMTGAAAIAIAAATPAFAQMENDTDSSVAITDDSAEVQTESDTAVDLDNDGEPMGDEIADAAEETGDYISETANDAGEAISETANDVAENVDETMDDMTPETLTASTLVGYEVAGENGEVIGEVDNVVLVNGEEMAVVGIGGFLGLGEHDVALPLSDLSTNTSAEGEIEMLKAEGYTKEQLESMAEFDPESAEEVSDDEPVMLGGS